MAGYSMALAEFCPNTNSPTKAVQAPPHVRSDTVTMANVLPFR
jgi:hypothetical protein|eukprot:COSAG06_NODE_265_length_18834_cov_10.938991_10_plen_43_part_00